jgi:hypothetical protein
MSIILNALKKAGQLQKKEKFLQNGALIRELEEDRISSKRRKRILSISQKLMGYIGSLIVIGLFIGAMGYLFYSQRNKNNPGHVIRSYDQAAPDAIGMKKNDIALSDKSDSQESTIPVVQKETPQETPIETPEETPKESPRETPVAPPRETPAETPREDPTPAPFPTPRSGEYDRPGDIAIRLEGVMWNINHPKVMINDKILSVGDTFDDMVIVNITKDYVAVKIHENIYKFQY